MNKLIGCVTATVISVLCFSLEAAGQTLTDVFTAGENKVHTYRIPAVVRAADGDILAFAEARHESSKDNGDIDIVMKRSSDGGHTWSEAVTVWDDADNVCGNPSPVVDRITGRLILLACWNDHDGKYKLTHGTYEARRVFVMTSDDNGYTWSTPRDITADVKLPDWKWYATGPCHAIQLQGGRIVVPCNHGLQPDKSEMGTCSHVIYSDDGGQSWHIGGDAGIGNESTVTELSNGDVMLNMRGGRPKDRASLGYARIVAVSHDQGLTFDTPFRDRQLIEPVCNASICNLATGTKPSRQLAFSNPCDSTKRRSMTLQVSPDDGRTWAKAALLSAWPSAYSDVMAMGDGSVGVLYENGKKGPYEKISFAIISKKQIRKALRKAR